MPDLPQSAIDFDARQRRITVRVIEEIAKQWGTLPPADFDAWFGRNVDRLVRIATQGQRAAVSGVDVYVDEVLEEQGTPARRLATLNPDRLVGVTGDGRTIDGLLQQAVVGAHERVASGEAPYRAWQQAGLDARLYIQTLVNDAGRAATGVGITSRLGVGYRRMLVPPSCSRCVILAGRYYHWSAGFRRHPGCNCKHIPCREDRAGDVRTEPRAYFNALTPVEQNRTFGAAGAQAIRDGADMSQVVNARRGLEIVGGRAQRRDVAGRQLLTTTEGVTRRGVAGAALRRRGRNARTTPRLMPEAIYEIAESREAAIELLRQYGYVL
ncbi:hypothetical protein [Nocardia brasiliensis]|uniref:VG15 protein n=1 Tax=Nocardia brasiliensis TaxID=37326 RepID=UPI002453A7EC|nr:hypothetical protein [Nocardia brasiliensis]